MANAPIIKSDWISKCLNILIRDKKISAEVPVIENNDNHPLRAKMIHKGYLRGYMKDNDDQSTNRQDLKLFSMLHFLGNWTNSIKMMVLIPGMQEKSKAFKIKDTIDIHDQKDLVIADIEKVKYKIRFKTHEILLNAFGHKSQLDKFKKVEKKLMTFIHLKKFFLEAAKNSKTFLDFKSYWNFINILKNVSNIKKYTGLDISNEMLESARLLHPNYQFKNLMEKNIIKIQLWISL